MWHVGEKPRTSRSQPPACTHKERNILTSAEATTLQHSFGIERHTLQDWGRLKKHVPLHKQGHVCPNGAPAKGNSNDSHDSE